jgi:hypothetical protein
LERRVQFDEPWTLCVGENIALGADMGKLIFLVLWNSLATKLVIARRPETYHLGLDKRFERVDLLVTLPLDKFDFTKCSLRASDSSLLKRIRSSSCALKEVSMTVERTTTPQYNARTSRYGSWLSRRSP